MFYVLPCNTCRLSLVVGKSRELEWQLVYDLYMSVFKRRLRSISDRGRSLSFNLYPFLNPRLDVILVLTLRYIYIEFQNLFLYDRLTMTTYFSVEI